MAATKTNASIYASGSVTAGGTGTGTAYDLRTAYGAVLLITMTNGGTGPSTLMSAYIYYSSDGSTNRLAAKVGADTVASSVTAFSFEVPIGVMYVNVIFKDHTGQAVTAEALIEVCTGI